MDAHDIAWLRTPEGAAAVRAAGGALAAGGGDLAVNERLRRDLDPARARAVLALLEGRRVAAGKFEDAERLYLDRSAAEQATSEAVARHTAKRFAGSRRIADLGCGAGGDTLALAERAPVVAVDRDAARLAMLRENANARGLSERVEVTAGDAERAELPAEVDAVWLDPGRRDERGRVLDPARWTPPLVVAIEVARRFQRAGIKVAPGIDLAHVPHEAEIEFISLRGNLVEAVLWLGEVVTAPRRATALPSGETIQGETGAITGDVRAPGAYLYDPDPGVGRASLVGALAERLGAWQLNERIAYLAADEPSGSALVRCFRVETWLPFSERRLLAALRDLGAGRVEVMRRGSPVDTNSLEVRLNRTLGGHGATLTVALTRTVGEHVAIVCERMR